MFRIDATAGALRPRAGFVAVPAALLLAIVPAAALGQTDTAAPSLLPVATALLAVLALIPVAVWLLKRLGAGTVTRIDGLQVVSQLPLGAGQRIVVLQAGNRWLLLGVTGGSITRLGSLPRPESDAGIAGTGPLAAPGFAALLARAIRGERTNL